MKKCIYSIIILLLGFIQLLAQEGSLPYRAFESFKSDTLATRFKGDTLAYITYNFGTRSDYYVGKTMEVFFDDLEIDIQSFMMPMSYLMIDILTDEENIQEISIKHRTYERVYLYIYNVGTIIAKEVFDIAVIIDINEESDELIEAVVKLLPEKKNGILKHEFYELFRDIKIEKLWVQPNKVSEFYRGVKLHERDSKVINDKNNRVLKLE